MRQQHALAVKKVDGTLSCIRQVEAGDPSRLLCGETQLECWVQAWAPQCKADMDILKQVQQMAMKIINSSEHLSYKKWLRELGLFSLEERRLRGIVSILNLSSYLAPNPGIISATPSFGLAQVLLGFLVEELIQLGPLVSHSIEVSRVLSPKTRRVEEPACGQQY
ncbi:hypothetical protein QYF61_022007 [Mycteria americana]|uniref:Uncharacterized protein n=1 Tax=Mycteria americana TaxID=33587 RepID=A0AAN7P7H2_MYCAM|nr:hypothetical protein QYF61_022007 [Mycteria americana]